MKDTTDAVSAMVAKHHALMTPEQRCRAASRMFDDARILVRSSLDREMPAAERWQAEMRRLYGSELPQAAILAFAAQASREDRALDPHDAWFDRRAMARTQAELIGGPTPAC